MIDQIALYILAQRALWLCFRRDRVYWVHEHVHWMTSITQPKLRKHEFERTQHKIIYNNDLTGLSHTVCICIHVMYPTQKAWNKSNSLHHSHKYCWVYDSVAGVVLISLLISILLIPYRFISCIIESFGENCPSVSQCRRTITHWV